ncbi:hypothetical protein SY89_02148 [Halolamina pelagica]|uniref:Uncharacterized protein n=1 Tax=Halolamina pelagica TaxID=699431 RepID=A0A0N8I060_9EURY|nr:hypothetical protein SY89_02148 [Halolamina pelagica]
MDDTVPTVGTDAPTFSAPVADADGITPAP